MYHIHIKVIMILIFSVQLVKTQAPPVISVVTTGPFQCGSDLILRCTPSSACCTSASKFWYKDTTVLINAGSSANPEKYTERDYGNTHFEMTIKKLDDSDFIGQYSCTFFGQPSNQITLNSTGFSCPDDPDDDCKKCGLWCWCYHLITYVVTVLVAVLIIHFVFVDETKCKVKVIVSGAVVSLVVTTIVSVLVGVYSCPCKDNKEAGNCIPFGLISILIFIIVVIISVKKNDLNFKGNEKAIPTEKSVPPVGFHKQS